jgi:hypothetical protein
MSGRLPAWLADWLGVPVPSNADTATWQLDTRWSWAPWATLLLVLVAIAWTVSLYARESGSASRLYRTALIALRLAAIGLVLVMLAQWALALWLTGPPSIALVIDHSASMNIADRYEDAAIASRLDERLAANGLTEPKRLNIAKLLLKDDNGRLLRELADRYRLAVYAAAGNVERLPESSSSTDLSHAVDSLTADGPTSQATRIGDALLRIADDFRGAPPAAVILLSDGVVTEGASLSDAAQNLRSAGVPILAVGIGSPKAPHDIELADVLVDDAVFVNDVVSFQAQIKATGLEGQPAKVVLRREGESPALAELAVVLPAAGKTLSVRLTDRPTKAGDVTYFVEVTPREDETDKNNNRQRRKVTVRDDKIRVLLAQGYPNYEFRFLKTLLERDRSVQLSTYLQDADPEYAEQDKSALRSFPVNRDDLLAYDVVIIGDVDPRLLPQSVWQNVRALVSEKGGGAVFIAGPKFLPGLYRENSDMNALLPVKLDSATGAADRTSGMSRGFTVRPTPLGLQSPAFQLGDTPGESEQIWSKLAPLYWFYPAGELKSGMQVLADGLGKPVICFQYFGAGRVLFHAIDSTWRWRTGGGEPFFARYWVQTIRFLAHGKLGKGRGVELTTDRREYRRGEAAHLRARFLDSQLAPSGEEVVVQIDAAGQARRRVTLRRNSGIAGVYEGSLADLTDGQYEVVMVEPQLSGNPAAAKFSVVPPPGEFARTEMDAAALSVAAEATRGKFYTVADADKLLADLPAGRRVPIRNLPPIPIWNRWWLLSAFLSCLTAEWILRKRKGML